MISYEKADLNDSEAFLSKPPKRSVDSLKIFFFILLSLNAVFFIWEHHRRSSSETLEAQLHLQNQDPSVERIVLVDEQPETSGSSDPNRKRDNSLGLKPADQTEEPPIFESVNQQLSRSIARGADRLIENLLEYESAERINDFQHQQFSELASLSTSKDPSLPQSMCCFANPGPVRFRAFDETASKTERDRIPREPRFASHGGPSDSDQTSNPTSNTENSKRSGQALQRSCFKLGPRFSESDFSPIIGDLTDQGVAVSVHIETIEVDTAFMVIYPAAESFEASKANRNILKQKGLKDQDFWLITKGEMRGDISLGVFKSRERAQLHRSELGKKGIDSLIKPKKSKRRAYFLSIYSPLPATMIQARVRGAGLENAELREAEPAVCVD